ncbi:MAG: FHA domain-containing protein [Spirochaetales bacterium]
MHDYTISSESIVGKRLDKIGDNDKVSYLTFKNNRIDLVAKITLGRSQTSTIVIENKLASRNHAIIQKIKNHFFLKDMGSTNGTYLNGEKIPSDKYIKVVYGDKITIGSDSIIMS